MPPRESPRGVAAPGLPPPPHPPPPGGKVLRPAGWSELREASAPGPSIPRRLGAPPRKAPHAVAHRPAARDSRSLPLRPHCSRLPPAAAHATFVRAPSARGWGGSPGALHALPRSANAWPTLQPPGPRFSGLSGGASPQLRDCSPLCAGAPSLAPHSPVWGRRAVTEAPHSHLRHSQTPLPRLRGPLTKPFPQCPLFSLPPRHHLADCHGRALHGAGAAAAATPTAGC